MYGRNQTGRLSGRENLRVCVKLTEFQRWGKSVAIMTNQAVVRKMEDDIEDERSSVDGRLGFRYFMMGVG